MEAENKPQTVDEYFQETCGSNCNECYFKYYCNHVNYTGGILQDPFCSCLNDEELKMDVEDLLIMCDNKNEDHINSAREKELKKEAIQAKRKATLVKNYSRNKQKTLE